jgi:tetratricopeptide (TPR) repeat protein
MASETVHGLGSSEVEQAFARARELSHELGGTSELAAVLYGLYVAYFGRAQHERAREVGQELLELARSVEDRALLLSAHSALTASSYHLGEFAAALAEAKQVIALEKPGSPVYGGLGERGLLTRGFAARALWCLGYPDQAIEMGEGALRQAEELAHPITKAQALYNLVNTLVDRGEWRAAQERVEVLIDLARRHGFPVFIASGTVYRGRALAGQGELEEGIANMRQGRAALRAMQTIVADGFLGWCEAEAWLARGTPEEGLVAVAEALEHIAKTAERDAAAAVYRVKGELLLIQSPPAPEEAEASFRRALEIARGQSAKSWELQAAMSLARLLRDRGRRDDARALLAPVYNWFTEGFDTADLKDAKALLDEL